MHQCDGLMRAFRGAEKEQNLYFGLLFHEEQLTPIQFNVLEVLHRKGELCVRQIMCEVAATPGNLTVVIKNMVRNGLIYRQTAPHDKRYAVIGLTEQGQQLFETVWPKYQERVRNILAHLTADEQSQCRQALERLACATRQAHQELVASQGCSDPAVCAALAEEPIGD